ncbi:MAG TPA: rod shape-determining protein MreC [Roseiflexaceae bacterium]|nr:rod shape-determining protein MreC [Roseiflexaceae bacterium]
MIRDRRLKIPRPSPYRAPTLVVALVLASVLLLALDHAGMLGPLRSQAETLISPALIGLRRTSDSLAGIGAGIDELQRLRAEVVALREENSRLKARAIQSEALLLENARLREQVRIEQERPWTLLGADVAAHTPDAGRRVLVLAAGSEQGVRPGMAVVAREGSSPPALIGVVESTGPRSASVLLITDYSSAISALVLRPAGHVGGIVQGQWQRGSRLLLQEVSRDDALAAGDTVVTAGLTAELNADLPRAAIPKNVPIGTVETVRPAGRGQEADLRPFVDPDRVHYAWVILSAGE